MPGVPPFSPAVHAAVSAAIAAGISRAVGGFSRSTAKAAVTIKFSAVIGAGTSTARSAVRQYDYALKRTPRCLPCVENFCEPSSSSYLIYSSNAYNSSVADAIHVLTRVDAAPSRTGIIHGCPSNRTKARDVVRVDTSHDDACVEKFSSRSCECYFFSANMLQQLRTHRRIIRPRLNELVYDPEAHHRARSQASAYRCISFHTPHRAFPHACFFCPTQKHRAICGVVSGRADAHTTTARTRIVCSSNSGCSWTVISASNNRSICRKIHSTSRSANNDSCHSSSVSSENSCHTCMNTEDRGLTFHGDREGTSECVANDKRVSSEMREASTHAFPSLPMEMQENDADIKKIMSGVNAPQLRVVEPIRTNASLHSTEAVANATSRQQWDVHAAVLRRVLQKAEFVSVDMELTGLHIRNEKFIGVDRCYEAHCEGARAFMPIQLGLCAARRAGPDHPYRWILTPASIYIFPLESRVFHASTATLSFLRESGLDFNEWIERGVPYMRAQEERDRREALEARIAEVEHLRSRVAEGSKSEGASLEDREVQPQVLPYELATLEDQELANTVRAAIHSWLTSGSRQPLHLPVDNPLQRLLLHSLVASEFPNLSSHSAKAGDRRVLAIYQSEGEVYEEQLRTLKEEVAKLEQLRGVRQILDDIAERRLVIVGHNCFYDLLHLYQTLYGDLPESVTAFKSSWIETFPYTFDTKLIAETHEVLAALQPPATLRGLCTFMATINAASRDHHSSSAQKQINEHDTRRNSLRPEGPLALEIQLERLPGTRWSLPTPVQSLSAKVGAVKAMDATEPPSLLVNGSPEPSSSTSQVLSTEELQVQPRTHSVSLTQRNVGDPTEQTKCKASTSGSDDEDYSHDAGYDSLMTSVVYLLQLAHVLPYHGLRWGNVHFGLSRTQPASVNLGGTDEQLLHQKRLLFMRNHPASWKKWEIMKIWSPVWVDVQMVDKSSSWLVARDEEDAQNIWTIYHMMKSPQFELLSYDQYRAVQRQGSSQQQQ